MNIISTMLAVRHGENGDRSASFTQKVYHGFSVLSILFWKLFFAFFIKIIQFDKGDKFRHMKTPVNKLFKKLGTLLSVPTTKFTHLTKKVRYFLNCIHFNEKKRQISCNFNIYKFGKVRYNITRKKKPVNYGRLLALCTTVTAFSGISILWYRLAYAVSLLCFFILYKKQREFLKKYGIYIWNML